MGEIADALRRVRGITTPPSRRSEETARPGLPGQPEPVGEPPRAPLTPPGAGPVVALPEIGGHQIEQLDPPSPAIAVGEGPVVEASRKVAVRVRAQLEERGQRSVAIVSANRNEGKTTVACNLALALASTSPGRKVALVDLDLRNPSVARVLGLEVPVAIEQVLMGRRSAADVQMSVRQPALDIYPSVDAQRSSHELLVTPVFEQLVAQLERRYATVVIDTPPVLLVPDTTLILQHVGACIPIARAGRTRERSFREMIENLPRSVLLDGLLNGGRTPGYYSSYYESEDVADEDGARAKRKKRGRRGRRR